MTEFERDLEDSERERVEGEFDLHLEHVYWLEIEKVGEVPIRPWKEAA